MYYPTEWKKGDVVTSAKLNNMESGIANAGSLVVHDVEGTLDQTWKTIYDAIADGRFVLMPLAVEEDGSTFAWLAYCDNVYFEDGEYGVPITYNGNTQVYSTDNENGYPALPPDDPDDPPTT